MRLPDNVAWAVRALAADTNIAPAFRRAMEAQMQTFTAAEKQACAERELKMRERVYEGRVECGRMTQAKADYEIAVMQAIADDYRRQAEAERAASDLFGATP